ncbi:MAG TPA: ABC transporter permease [Anaerolineales bacterium]|nr:ABC transporter permease [Anaerolineales bacterium]
MRKSLWIHVAFQLGALVAALLLTTLILVAVGAPPLGAYASILRGAFGSSSNLENLLISWSPLLLTSAGVLITFSAGLWNIGVEGQMVLGAIFATGMLRSLQDTGFPPALIIALGILAGAVGGALWAGVAGALKTFGGVNEIFGGLGLNFVSTALTIYLVFGPWKRPGTGSMSGTQPFDRTLWLPSLPDMQLSPWSLALSILAILCVFLLLRGTHFGLRLKAVGKNSKAAFLMGVPTWQYSLFAFLLCGAFAGLAGAIQVTGVYHRLLPNISNGYGFLGLLVAMLVNYQAIWAAPVAFFFASLNTGSVQLQLLYQLDSSFSGVLQSFLVLLVLLGEGARQRFLKLQWKPRWMRTPS